MASPHYKGSSLRPDEYIEADVDKAKVVIKPVGFDITWGSDNRYWRIDRVQRIAELIQVCWLEVNGSVEMKHLQPSTTYKLEFKVRLKADAFGWNDSPVYIMVMPGKNRKWAKFDLSQINKGQQNSDTIPSSLEFITPNNTTDKVSFGLFEIWKGRWKGGLVIEEVVISKKL